MGYRDSNIPEEYQEHPDKHSIQRINIVIRKTSLTNDLCFNNLFAPDAADTEKTAEIYKKCLFKDNDKFKLYWVKHGYQLRHDDSGLKINGAVLILDICQETKETLFSKVYSFLNEDSKFNGRMQD